MKFLRLIGGIYFGLIQVLPAQNFSTTQLKGRASYYGDFFHGRRTASGERFDINKFTAAHRTLPFGTMVKVTNMANQKSVILKINDRGPHIRSRIIDLSKAAAKAIDLMRYGAARVSIEVLKNTAGLKPGPVNRAYSPSEFLNTALYLPGNTYNFWGNVKSPIGYGFQVGVFTDLISARETCQQLLLKGQNEVYIQVGNSNSGKIYRIMLRHFASRQNAESEIACLSEFGLKGFVRPY